MASQTPVVTLVGRPNVGKSTLFNRLTARRDALVADVPGLTRDRRYGHARIDGAGVVLVDTGGLFGDPGEIANALQRQVGVALEEADLVLFLVDARQGLTVGDEELAQLLRRHGTPVVLVVNKVDGVSEHGVVAEFAGLGFAHTVYTSASHGRGMQELTEVLSELVDLGEDQTDVSEPTDATVPGAAKGAIKVALIGRPNVGKSTLTNRLLGEDRQLVLDAPGTTRDAIAIPLAKEGEDFLLIDTAGIRRKGKVAETVEKFSVVKTLAAIIEAHVAIIVLDAREGVVEQDLHLLGYAAEAGCGVLVAVNKWDGLSPSERDAVKRELDRRLRFAPWVAQMFISALHGTGVGHLPATVKRIFEVGRFNVTTSVLTRILTGLTTAHPPPSVRGRLIKLRFAHKLGAHPPRIVIHGNQTAAVPASYVRYLENGFREALDLQGNPVLIELKTGVNPYADRRNPLTPRQRKRRQRLIQHRKRRR